MLFAETMEEAIRVALSTEEIIPVEGGYGIFAPGEYEVWEQQK